MRPEQRAEVLRGKPPHVFVQMAVAAANRSPCQKSKRGAVVWDARDYLEHGDDHAKPLGVGYNSLPAAGICDGSEACRRDCGKICEHAEARAIAQAASSTRAWSLAMYSEARPFLQVAALAGAFLVHAKVVNGALAPGGTSSCWQCSKAVVAASLGGVWLYESVGLSSVPAGSAGTWVFYTALEFHSVALAANGLHEAKR